MRKWLEVSIGVLAMAGLVGAASAPRAWAGEGENGSPAADAQAKPEQLKISGEIKIRGEVRDKADFGAGTAGTAEYVGQLTRLAFSGEIKHVRYMIELMDGREFGAERKTGTATSTGLLQSYVELGKTTKVRFGRQELSWGRKRQIGTSGWDYKQLPAYDGVRLLTEGQRTAFDTFAVRVAEQKLDVADDTNLLGANFTWKAASGIRPGFYVLLLQADDDPTTEAHDQTTMPILGAIGELGPRAGLSLDYEAILQTGTRAGRDHRAYLVHVGLLYKQPAQGRYWVGAEYNLASGDKDPTDHKSQTFDKLYGINHSHYGYIDYQDPRNMANVRLVAGVKLAGWASVEGNLHHFSLVQARDAWYSRNAKVDLQDESGASGKEVGWEVDLMGTFDLPTKQKLEIGLSDFMPGSFVRRTNEGHAQSSLWAYVQLRSRF